MNCLICQSKENLKFLDEYKLEIKQDVKFFKDLKIFHCNDCEFSFANPMPLDRDLNFFYKNIYRSANRPPYWVPTNFKDLDTNLIEDKNLNYLLYLSTLIDLKKIQKIFDFGAGYGNLGFLLKRKFPNLELYCSESDEVSKDILKDRGYKNFENIHKIDTKFDLIISLHSLEHLTNLEIFSKFNEILNKNGLIFFEVPNCSMEYFNGRPYDSPHLLFYSKKSFEKISKKYNFNIINFSYSSYTFESDHKYQLESQNQFNQLNSSKFNIQKFKKFLKNFLPKSLLNLRNNFLEAKKMKEISRIDWFTNNSGNNCYIRGILIKK